MPSIYSPPLPPRRLTLGLLAFLCLLYVPFAGAYGLWDPWESHYAEVARQMVERGDWISLWWPGSPQDPVTFWSKPVLTFWLMALSMKLFGLGAPGAVHAAEMTVGWTAEWALRLPFVLLGIAGVWATYQLVRRTAGRGAALWAALCLGTCTQWALITRQAMTDMAFVTPMTAALVFFGLALLLPEAAVGRALPRWERRITPGLRLSFPKDRFFYGFFAAYCLLCVPQLILFSAKLGTFTVPLLGRLYRAHGIVGVLPFWGLFLLSAYWIARARDRRSLYLLSAYALCGVATLAKGPAGLVMPLVVVLLFAVLSGRARQILRLEILRGGLVFLCVCAPWYGAMLLRHGAPFWMEIIGDNYVRRAQGRHGDRGTFEYYLRQLGAGLYPWSGVVAASLFCCGRWLRSPRRQLVLLCLCWFVADFVIVSLVNTKFHHYILPALPALCVLSGLLLEELCGGAGRVYPRDGVMALLLVGLPTLWLSGRDLGVFPARIGWLFNYDYVNAPGSGRPWPVPTTYGQRYEYGAQVLVFVVLALLAMLLLLQRAWRRGPVPTEADPDVIHRPPLSLLAALFLLLLGIGVASAPSAELVARFSSSKLPMDALLSSRLRLGFLVPAACAGLWLLGLFVGNVRGRPGVRAAALALGLVAVAWNAWVLDRFLVDLSPHWSQKHIFATYYRLRKGPEEPVIAWYMYWRGENFYSRNQIFDQRLPAEEKTVFLGDNHAEKLKSYLLAHRGRRVFVLMERHRLEQLRGLLSPEAKDSLQVVDDSNNKVYLVVVSL